MTSSSPGLSNVTALNSTGDDVSRGPRVVFLLVFILLSLLGDAFLVSALATAHRRKLAQNALIANMCAIGLVDCFCNMSLVLGSVASSDWSFGQLECRINTFFMSLVTVQTVLMLAAFSLDRFLMLRFSFQYESWVSSCRLAAALVYVWIHSVAFSVPFTTSAAPSTFREKLHICTVTKKTSLGFVCTTLIACYLCPVLITIGFHVFHARLSCKRRYIRQAQNVGKTYTQMSKEETITLDPVKTPFSNYLSPILFTLWLILELPFIITNYIKQYEYSRRLENDTISYPWEVDATFLWMRFLYTALFPCSVFLCRKDLWQRSKDCFLCRRSNAIKDVKHFGLEPTNSPVQKSVENNPPVVDKAESKEPPKISETPRVASYTGAFTVPVLFATSTGICIEDSSGGQDSQTEESNESASSTLEMAHLKGKALDICYPACEYAHELVGDTSDYDSSCETDLYSTSQPVSVRNVQGSLQTHRGRSVSSPEIASSLSPSQKLPSRGLSGTCRTDSGLDIDLSGTYSQTALAASIRPANRSEDNSQFTISSTKGCLDQGQKHVDIYSPTTQRSVDSKLLSHHLPYESSNKDGSRNNSKETDLYSGPGTVSAKNPTSVREVSRLDKRNEVLSMTEDEQR